MEKQLQIYQKNSNDNVLPIIEGSMVRHLGVMGDFNQLALTVV